MDVSRFISVNIYITFSIKWTPEINKGDRNFKKDKKTGV